MSATHFHPLSNRPPCSISGAPDKLHVISVISNPVRYSSRYNLYRQFEKYMKDNEPLIEFHPVELAFGRRPFELDAELRLRTYDEIWHKENMINLAIQKLPPGWKYVAWIDADIEFQRKDWAEETMHQLQHYMVVQMFQNAVDIGPNGEFLARANGFMWSYLNGKPKPQIAKDGKTSYGGYGYTAWHSGFAWAARREAIDALGGLYDVSMLGSGDHLMAWGLIGRNILPQQMSPGYHKSLQDWIDRAERYIMRDVGFVPGTVLHYFHGKKANRRYNSRWQILEDFGFDPTTDIKRDYQGLYQLDVDGSERMIGMRDAIRDYMRGRDEDNTSL